MLIGQVANGLLHIHTAPPAAASSQASAHRQRHKVALGLGQVANRILELEQHIVGGVIQVLVRGAEGHLQGGRSRGRQVGKRQPEGLMRQPRGRGFGCQPAGEQAPAWAEAGQLGCLGRQLGCFRGSRCAHVLVCRREGHMRCEEGCTIHGHEGRQSGRQQEARAADRLGSSGPAAHPATAALPTAKEQTRLQQSASSTQPRGAPQSRARLSRVVMPAQPPCHG